MEFLSIEDLLKIPKAEQKKLETDVYWSNIKSSVQKIMFADKQTPVPPFVIALMLKDYSRQYNDFCDRDSKNEIKNPDDFSGGAFAGYYRPSCFMFDISKNTNSYAENFDNESFQNFLLDIISEAENDDGLSYALLFCGRFADNNTAKKLITSLNKAIQASLAEFLMPTMDTIEVVVRRSAIVLGKSRTAVMFAEKESLMHEYAEIHGKSLAQVRYELADFGFDESGLKKYDIGSKIIEAVICPDMTISLTDTKTSKIVKSIPKRGSDPELYEKANEDFKTIKSLLKKVYQSCVKAVFNDFLSGDETSVEDWTKMYKNPIFKPIFENVIWVQNNSSFVISSEGNTFDCHCVEYSIKDDEPISVMHPHDTEKEIVLAWQDYFVKNSLCQPFEQIYEPAYSLDKILDNRYSNSNIPYYRFTNKQIHGIKITARRFHNSFDIKLKDCRINFEKIKPKGGFGPGEVYQQLKFCITSIKVKNTRYANHIIYLLDKWTLAERILHDDGSIRYLLEGCTITQILEYIDLASKNNCVNAAAVLLDYRLKNFADYGGIDSLDSLMLPEDF